MLLPLLALVCTLAGFLVIVTHALAPRAGWLTALRRRGLEVHYWGVEVLGAGSLLAGVTWATGGVSWPELSLPVRIAAPAGILCAALYLTVAGAALSGRGERRRRAPRLDITPRVGERVPARYAGLLLLGTLVLSVLVAWSV